MLKKGDLAIIDCPKSMYHNVKVKLVSEPYDDYGDRLADIEIVETGEKRPGCIYKFLKLFEITITIGGASTWQDKDDSSRIDNVRPGIHAACYYTDDGSCWEWLVTTKATGVAIVGTGRSIDRATAKSDAEFFIANYKPEDTSERDDIRRKLERSWHK